MFKTELLIGGESTATPLIFERVNPSNGKCVNKAYGARAEDVARACEAAAAAFANWSQSPPALRRDILLKAEAALAARAPEIIEAMQAELGASAPWAAFNIHLAEGLIREAAAMTSMIGGQLVPSDIAGMTAMTARRPAGVVLSIAPWNAPIILAARAIAMPLACGNSVILKGSEICPQTHWLVVQSFLDAGLPAGALTYLNNRPEDASEIVGALIKHEAIRRINYTGSTKTGKIIARHAADALKPCLLELGGKAPMLVLDDAELDEAARAASFGSFINSGQICMSTERILVDEKIADSFIEKFAASAARLGIDKAAEIPLDPLAQAGAPDRLAALIDDAIGKGAKPILHGARDGARMAPTILDGVTPQMKLYHEESFGPVVAILRFATPEQAIDIANDTEYGLVASVFGRDIGRALALAERLDVGMCHVNMATVHDQPHMPFGGVKASGYGRFNGMAAVYAFTEQVLTTYRSTPAEHYPF